MAIEDYEGIYYFKYFVPILFIISVVAMIVGIASSSIHYRFYCLVAHIYYFFKMIYQVILTIRSVMKGNQALKRITNQDKFQFSDALTKYKIYHAIVIPNYKEDIQIISQTLQVLAKHKRALDSYLIYLAMQKHQENSEIKAQNLVQKFKKSFKNIDYTVHQVKGHQAKGKASNISWCAQQIQNRVKKMNIDIDNVFVTIMDADSWAPNPYFNQLEKNIYQNMEKRYLTIFQPNQIYARNNYDVPIIVRTYDDTYSSMHSGTLATFCSVSLSFSNYSLSYNLIKQIGFWDTNEQAIAQDAHMVFKSFFQTKGEVLTVPIFIPFNQLNVQTGKGYVQDVKAKIWQLQRHSRALIEIGYCILMVWKKLFSLKSLLLLYVVIDNFLMAVILPFPILSILINDQVFQAQVPKQGILSSFNYFILLNVSNLIAGIMVFLYQHYKREASKVLYGIQSRSTWRYIQYLICYVLNFGIMLPVTQILGSFGGLKKNRQYFVAEKVVKKVNSNQEPNNNFQLQFNQQESSQLLNE